MQSETGFLEWIVQVALAIVMNLPWFALIVLLALIFLSPLLWRLGASLARRSRLALGAVLLALIVPPGALAVWAWYVAAGPGRYAELEFVTSTLAALPEVEVVESGGNEDVTLENLWARVRLEGRGEIELMNLDYDSFEEANTLVLRSIGPFELIVQGEGYVGVYRQDSGAPVRSQFWSGSIEIGPGESFAHFFPFQCVNVRDVIARYDDICAVLATWPVQPEYAHLRDEDGTDYYYSVRDPELDEDWLELTELR